MYFVVKRKIMDGHDTVMTMYYKSFDGKKLFTGDVTQAKKFVKRDDAQFVKPKDYTEGSFTFKHIVEKRGI